MEQRILWGFLEARDIHFWVWRMFQFRRNLWAFMLKWILHWILHINVKLWAWHQLSREMKLQGPTALRFKMQSSLQRLPSTTGLFRKISGLSLHNKNTIKGIIHVETTPKQNWISFPNTFLVSLCFPCFNIIGCKLLFRSGSLYNT